MIQFTATLGINEGYKHSNNTENLIDIVTDVWQKNAKKVFEDTGVYISAVISESRTVYHEDWGCPKGGEQTALIIAQCNPNFTNTVKYKECVISVLKLCKEELKQSTVQVGFGQIEFIYLDK